MNFAGEIDEVPRMYDINNDSFRAVTQRDVDRLLRIEAAFVKIHLALKEVRDDPT